MGEFERAGVVRRACRHMLDVQREPGQGAAGLPRCRATRADVSSAAHPRAPPGTLARPSPPPSPAPSPAPDPLPRACPGTDQAAKATSFPCGTRAAPGRSVHGLLEIGAWPAMHLLPLARLPGRAHPPSLLTPPRLATRQQPPVPRSTRLSPVRLPRRAQPSSWTLGADSANRRPPRSAAHGRSGHHVCAPPAGPRVPRRCHMPAAWLTAPRTGEHQA